MRNTSIIASSLDISRLRKVLPCTPNSSRPKQSALIESHTSRAVMSCLPTVHSSHRRTLACLNLVPPALACLAGHRAPCAMDSSAFTDTTGGSLASSWGLGIWRTASGRRLTRGDSPILLRAGKREEAGEKDVCVGDKTTDQTSHSPRYPTTQAPTPGTNRRNAKYKAIGRAEGFWFGQRRQVRGGVEDRAAQERRRVGGA